MKKPDYTRAEDEIIMNNYKLNGAAHVALMLGRTVKSIQQRYAKIKTCPELIDRGRLIREALRAKKKAEEQAKKERANRLPEGAIVINGHICKPKPPGPRHAAYMAGQKGRFMG